ncbi:MAG: DNA adenine methylase [Anaerolineae bacterium]|nr:DNA adenine methylase [Anaerolineae bacterium]
MKPRTVPHPIPYQGSKRNLAPEILRYFPSQFTTLLEPFAGSAAITLAGAANGLGERYFLNDLNEPLANLWRAMIEDPEKIASQYERLWYDQLEDPRAFYDQVRSEFNRTGRPDYFLYLLARCVKGSVRYNSQGEFNQSPDNRRRGMKPETMRLQVFGASYYLKGKTAVTSVDYREVLESVSSADLVYMDPPYQGVCGSRDSRYLQNVEFWDFVDALEALNRRGIRYLVSYDGRTGDKIHGEKLPDELNLTLIELYAGRSSQATLLGRNDVTIESLYLSPGLADELAYAPVVYRFTRGEQLCLLEGRL